MENTTRRGNYESGSDYVLEYGELRFSFNEQDFAQRVEQAAVKLDFVDQGLELEELHDLLELAVNGEIEEPASALGEDGTVAARVNPNSPTVSDADCVETIRDQLDETF